MSILKTVPNLSAVFKIQKSSNWLVLQDCVGHNFTKRRSVRALLSRHFCSPVSDPENLGQRQTGVNFETLGSWNTRLELSINEEHSVKAGRLVPNIDISNIGVGTLLGRRTKNEDRTHVQQLQNDIMLFAVYDGHGGDTAVDYMKENMAAHVQYHLDRGEKDLAVVLKQAFSDINNAFTKHLYHHHIGQENHMISGTTASVCLLSRGVKLVVAHVGDSQVLDCRDGQVICLTSPHRPEGGEKKRIEKAGGRVIYDSLGHPRVNGSLEMSRSLGDVELKAYGVIADPDLTSLSIKHGRDAFLVLTTDGVHCVLNNQEIIDIICTCQTPDEAAKFLVDQALHYGSQDNTTALIVPFGSWGKFAESKSPQFSFSRSVVGGRY